MTLIAKSGMCGFTVGMSQALLEFLIHLSHTI